MRMKKIIENRTFSFNIVALGFGKTRFSFLTQAGNLCLHPLQTVIE